MKLWEVSIERKVLFWVLTSLSLYKYLSSLPPLEGSTHHTSNSDTNEGKEGA